MSTTFEVPLDGATLVGDSWPVAGPAVTLLHAGVADRRGWASLVPELSDLATVHTYDRRGFGESFADRRPFTHVDDLFAVLDFLNIDSTWLVGSSGGGKLALDAALTQPQRIKGLVLIAPAISGAPAWRDEDVDSQTEQIDDLLTRAEEAGHTDEVNRLEVRLWLDGPRESEGRVSGSVRDLTLEMNAIALANSVPEDATRAIGAWSRLGELSMPTTVLCGSYDATHIIRRSEAIAERISGAQYLSLDGMAHLPYLESPSAVGALIRDSL